VRVLAGAALATIGVSIALGLELALLEPWLSGILARRMAGEALPTVPSELFVIVTLFSIIVLAALFASARIARAFRLPALIQFVPGVGEQGAASAMPRHRIAPVERAESERSRATAVANFISSVSRRDRLEVAAEPASAPGAARIMPMSDRGDSTRPSQPVGRSFRRQARARVTASANKRDAVV